MFFLTAQMPMNLKYEFGTRNEIVELLVFLCVCIDSSQCYFTIERCSKSKTISVEIDCIRQQIINSKCS